MIDGTGSAPPVFVRCRRNPMPPASLRRSEEATYVAPDVLERGRELLSLRSTHGMGSGQPPHGERSGADDSGPLKLIVTAPDVTERTKLKKLFLQQDPQNRITVDLPLIRGFAVEVSPTAIQILPDLHKTAHDVRVFLDGDMTIPEPPDANPGKGASARLDVATHAMGLDELWDVGITGKGVTIAVIDTGIAQHPDVRDRIIAFKDYVNGETTPYDDHGHGTHVSSICAGDGQASQGRYKGCAPDANLVGVKVLDKNGTGSNSKIIQAIQWILENKDAYGIGVINMSLGGTARQSYKDDPVAQAVEAAAAAGVVPCVAAGNNGPTGKTINSPAHALDAFTVGALDDRGTIDRSDDTLASFSGRGPTPFDGLTKPDFVAPGVNITAADSRSNGYRTMSGTSMATPMVAGSVALLRQARPDLTPAQIKEALMETATPLANIQDPDQQGSGSIAPADALAAAPIEAHFALATGVPRTPPPNG